MCLLILYIRNTLVKSTKFLLKQFCMKYAAYQLLKIHSLVYVFFWINLYLFYVTIESFYKTISSKLTWLFQNIFVYYFILLTFKSVTKVHLCIFYLNIDVFVFFFSASIVARLKKFKMMSFRRCDFSNVYSLTWFRSSFFTKAFETL